MGEHMLGADISQPDLRSGNWRPASTESTEGDRPLLAAENLCKRFYATQALDHACLDLRAGEVHGVVGENGAGKSTLIKILGGVYQSDSGRILLHGGSVAFASPADAFSRGIAVIQQELRVVPALSVAENVMLGHLPISGRVLRHVDRKRMREAAGEALKRLRVHLDLDRPVASLRFAERQSIVIARALSRDIRILLLDEPTAALESREVESLFQLIEHLKKEGIGIIYVSHSLDEVLTITDRCTVIRDGRMVAEFARGSCSTDDLARQMTGRDIEFHHVHREKAAGELMLETEEGPEIKLKSGEITGLAGLLGSGTSDVLLRLFGARGGVRARKQGSPIELRHPAQANGAGVGYIPNERALGLVLGLTVRDNILLPNLRRFGSFWRMDNAAIDRVVNELIDALDIRPANPRAIVRSLSGGNQQKVVIAKWLAAEVDVMLMDEPTQGIDVAAKAQIHRLIQDFSERGGTVLFASTDLQELLSLSDFVLAMKDDRITAHMGRGDGLSEQDVRAAISG